MKFKIFIFIFILLITWNDKIKSQEQKLGNGNNFIETIENQAKEEFESDMKNGIFKIKILSTIGNKSPHFVSKSVVDKCNSFTKKEYGVELELVILDIKLAESKFINLYSKSLAYNKLSYLAIQKEKADIIKNIFNFLGESQAKEDEIPKDTKEAVYESFHRMWE